ncbi:MAG TPA: hypothetical protein VEF89_16275 [Solirubrobacteraceae bacterium]|nr:hypothetical protein [Solirubrobacteraceae bacterium]
MSQAGEARATTRSSSTRASDRSTTSGSAERSTTRSTARLVGTGAQPTCQTLTPWFTGYKRYRPYTPDPTESGVWSAPDLATARRLITASHKCGTSVTIWLTAGTPPPVARYLVTLLDQLGYQARLRDVSTEPYSQEYAQIADSRTRAQAFTFEDGAVYPAASQLIETYFGCNYFIPNSPVNGNIAELCDPRLDARISNALAAEAGNSPDAQPWARADRAVVDDAPQVPLVISGYVIFVSNRVGNFQASAEQGVLPDQLWIR